VVCNVISGYGKFWTLDEIFQWKGIMADKKQFSNTKSIVKVETGIVTLIYREIFEVPGVYEKRIIFCGQLAGINLDS
jgi:hypothetical protein